jgi:hypothetical protein
MNGKNAAHRDLTIKIGLNGKNITTDPSGAPHVASGGTLTWECPLGPWAVVFDGRQSPDGPFEDNDRERRHGDGKSAKVRKHTGHPETYKYTVAFYDDASGDVYVADPEVVVDPDPE